MLFHYVQQKPSDEEVGEPGLDQGSSKPAKEELSDGARSKLSDEGGKENGENTERESVGRSPLPGESPLPDIRTDVKEKTAKNEEEKVKEEQVNEDLVAGYDMSRDGQGDKYVIEDRRGSLRHQPNLSDLEKEGRDREADRTGEKEGRYNYKQGPSTFADGNDEKEGLNNYKQGRSNIREEDEEVSNEHKQQGSSLPSTFEPEQV